MTQPSAASASMPEPTPSSASAGGGGAAATAPVDPLAAALDERDDFRDRLLRSHAELDNFRKRAQRERDEERRYAVGPIARDLLPILDNLRRAVAAAERGGTIDDLRQGVAMVLQQAEEVLAKHSVRPISSLGQPFDPNVHEALTQIPTDEHPPLTVVQEAEAGYMLHDRVLRPAKVLVSAPKPSPAG